MATGISYLNDVYNVTAGCFPVSPACDHCYAARVTQRFHPDSDLVTDGKFNGRVITLPHKLDQPLHWRRPRKIGVCFMSDLFHEKVKGAFIDRVADVALKCPQHDFFFLTKRADRLWILPNAKNIWAGVTVEDAKHIYRLDELRKAGAEHNWVSIEPFLEWFDITPYLDFLDWVVFGGESGAGAREMDANWPLHLMNKCEKAHVPYYFKQRGSAYKNPLPIPAEWQQLPKERGK